MAGFGEPFDWTQRRQQDAVDYFPTLEYVEPDDNMEVDMSMLSSGQVPSAFSQSAMNLASFGAQTRAPQQQEKPQSGGFLSGLFNLISEVDKPLSQRLGFKAEGQGALSSIENIAMEEATRPSNILLAAGGLLTGGLSTGAAGARIAAGAAARAATRNIITGVGARVAAEGAGEALDYLGVENPLARQATQFGAGFAGGGITGLGMSGLNAWRNAARAGMLSADDVIRASAEASLAEQQAARAAAQVRAVPSRFGYLMGGGEKFGPEDILGGINRSELPDPFAEISYTRRPAGSTAGASASGIGGAGVPPIPGAGATGAAGGAGGAGRGGGVPPTAPGGAPAPGVPPTGGGASVFQQQQAANQAAAQAQLAARANVPLTWSDMSWGERGQSILAMPMHLRSTFDLSAPRQLQTLLSGNLLSGKDGIERNKRIFIEQFKSFANEQNFLKHYDSIVNSANAKTYANMGLEFSDLIGTREEQIGSALLGRLPGIRNSDRAYSAAINEARRGLADSIIEKIANYSPQLLNNQEEMQKIGRFIMASTGRGDILNAIAQNKLFGANVIWAPRLLASRIQLPFTAFASGAGWLNDSQGAAKFIAPEAWKQVVAFTGINGALLQGLKAAGAADVDWDPRSSDFGTIRWGDRRIDTLGGYRPIINLATRVGINGYNAVTGDEKENIKQPYDITGDSYYYNKPTYDVMKQFIRSKLAPVPAAVVNQMYGKDFLGGKVGSYEGGIAGNLNSRAQSLLTDLLVPMSLESLWQETASGWSENVKQYGGQRAAEIAGKQFLNGFIPNIVYMQGVGGGLYVPNPRQMAYMGRYRYMTPEKQLQAIKDVTWYAIRPYYGGSDFQNYRAFKENHIKNLANIYQNYGYNKTEAKLLAEKNYPQMFSVDKNFEYLKDMYENEWVAENPEIATQIIADDLTKPANERTLSATDFQKWSAYFRS